VFKSIAQKEMGQRGEKAPTRTPNTTGRRALITRIPMFSPVPVNWLWPGRFALGKLSLIAGDPGLGKSLLTAAMSAVISKGYKWPLVTTLLQLVM